jgi:hypothetical protein
VAALDGFMCPMWAVVEFIVGEAECEVEASWHALLLELHAATPYRPQRARPVQC